MKPSFIFSVGFGFHSPFKLECPLFFFFFLVFNFELSLGVLSGIFELFNSLKKSEFLLLESLTSKNSFMFPLHK